MRLAWTRENVAFANPCFNSNGRDMTQCAADAGVPDLHDAAGQHRAVARQRRHPARRTRSPGSCPGQGRPRHQAGRQVRVRRRRQHQPGQHERHLRVRPQRRAVRCQQPVHLSRSLTIRVGGESRFYEKAHYVTGFAQDKWRMNNRLTLSLGLRYDLEVIPIPGDRRPDHRRGQLPGRHEQLRSRGSASPTTSAAAAGA